MSDAIFCFEVMAIIIFSNGEKWSHSNWVLWQLQEDMHTRFPDRADLHAVMEKAVDYATLSPKMLEEKQWKDWSIAVQQVAEDLLERRLPGLRASSAADDRPALYIKCISELLEMLNQEVRSSDSA